MNLSDFKQLITSPETERIEYKEARSSFSVLGWDKRDRKCVLGYSVAIGNEGGGVLVLWVNDKREIVGTNAIPNPEEVKSQIYTQIGKRIEIEELWDSENRVVIIHIPERPRGDMFRFYGIPLMRVGEELREMDTSMQREILNEVYADFSAQICSGATLPDLDNMAVRILQERWSTKSHNPEILTLPTKKLLSDLELTDENGHVTYAAMILLWKRTALSKYCPQAEIIYEYRRKYEDIESADRVDFRQSVLITFEELWNKIYTRNTKYHVQEGFFIFDIDAFDEETIRESILNAITHRDYRDGGSIFVRQYDDRITIENPGGFPLSANLENLLPLPSRARNRRIAEVFQKIGFVERSGQWMDKIYRRTIEQGKGLPDYHASQPDHVRLDIWAVVQDKRFLEYLNAIAQKLQVSLGVDDLYILERIRSWDWNIPKDRNIEKLLWYGLIESVGKWRWVHYILSHRYYESIGHAGEHTRLTGISREERKILIIKHLQKNKKTKREEFLDIWPTMKNKDLSNLLQELKSENKIKHEGSRWHGYWELKNNET